MSRDDWLLNPVERGNAHTVLDRRGGRDTAWTDGNRVEALVHGETY